jgi:hypothetical protein
MATEIICPCGCGKKFEPIFIGYQKKYATLACGNRVRQRNWLERQKKKLAAAGALNQSSLPFKRTRAKVERRVKSRSLSEQGREERLFA